MGVQTASGERLFAPCCFTCGTVIEGIQVRARDDRGLHRVVHEVTVDKCPGCSRVTVVGPETRWVPLE